MVATHRSVGNKESRRGVDISDGEMLSALPPKADKVRLKYPLRADIIAKVANRGAIIFPSKDKTGRDRRLIWPQAYYRSRR